MYNTTVLERCEFPHVLLENHSCYQDLRPIMSQKGRRHVMEQSLAEINAYKHYEKLVDALKEIPRNQYLHAHPYDYWKDYGDKHRPPNIPFNEVT